MVPPHRQCFWLRDRGLGCGFGFGLGPGNRGDFSVGDEGGVEDLTAVEGEP